MKTIKTNLAALAILITMTVPALAQTAPAAQANGSNLVSAEQAVKAARGECRKFANGPKVDGMQKTKTERSADYRACITAKETGATFDATPIQPKASTAASH